MLPDKTARRSFFRTLCLIAAGVLGNLLFSFIFTQVIGIPLFMDSIMTVAVTFCAGLLPGLLTGVFFNMLVSLCIFKVGPQVAFALCSVSTVLLVHFCRPKKISSWPAIDLVILSLLVCFANSILGGIISTFLFGGVDHFLSDYVIAGMLMQRIPLAGAAILARIPMNILDKTIAVFAGYGISLLLLKLPGFAGEETRWKHPA